MQGFGGRQALLVQPGLAVLPNGVDDKSVAFPMANGFSEPGGIRIRRMWASIGEDLPPHMRSAFINDEGEAGRLHDPERIGSRRHARDSRRKAASLGIVFGDVVLMLLVHFLSPGLKRDLDSGGHQVDVLTDRIRRPGPRKIGLAVRCTGSGAGRRPCGLHTGLRNRCWWRIPLLRSCGSRQSVRVRRVRRLGPDRNRERECDEAGDRASGLISNRMHALPPTNIMDWTTECNE